MMLVNRVSKRRAKMHKWLWLMAWVLAGEAAAQTAYEQVYERCVERAATFNNRVIFECTAAAGAAIERDKNKVMRQLVVNLQQTHGDSPDLAASHVQTLAQTEQAWQRYAEEKCALEGQIIGTPAEPLCVQQEQERRLGELNSLLKEVQN